MSQYDDRDPAEPAPDRPTGDGADRPRDVGQQPVPPPPSADEGHEGWRRPEHTEPLPAYGEPTEPPPSYDEHTAPLPAYGPEHTAPLPAHEWTPGPDPQGYPPYGYYAAPPAAPRTSAALPGWLWPVVAATALVVGLLGGTLGGVAVSRSMSGGTVDLPVIDGSRGTSAPLEADNGSISAVASALLPSTVQILARGGAGGGGGATGSGFVLDADGHVITNNHVVADATGPGEIEVVDLRGRTYDATIVGRSPVYDIAVLDVKDAERLRPAALGSSKAMRVGDSVVAIGSPLGLSSTVTSGIVSALDRPVTTGTQDESSYINAVQTDAAINPGNSGGPLVNMRGQVVGVNSAIATTGGSFGGESGNIGVGFAIPMEQVQITASQILTTGEAKYPVIGANVNIGGRGGDGAEVVAVPADTPADDAGLRKGDVVVAVEDTQVTDGIGLIVAIRSHQPGEVVVLTVRRDGEEKQVRIRLDAKVG
ncbi:S1C family serine protease [Nocardioides mesophilus]|uniref:Trypsin-like peptidase domain-containing protein n=1 Tax=Nocardioides mesophilus TaxID=433659 RepID=A0A7G9R808_9ACTN|nr:trypsin-like peptidase domain-containing protein [Nocardioides mesophilus]QNN51733.1 trypsin-like peptidase domain-containing protein [Nocardioides mesophilus]